MGNGEIKRVHRIIPLINEYAPHDWQIAIFSETKIYGTRLPKWAKRPQGQRRTSKEQQYSCWARQQVNMIGRGATATSGPPLVGNLGQGMGSIDGAGQRVRAATFEVPGGRFGIRKPGRVNPREVNTGEGSTECRIR
jgi:hypothetical protein